LYDTKEARRRAPEEMDEATLAALLLEYADVDDVDEEEYCLDE